MTLEFSVEIYFDVQLSILFRDKDTIDKQSEVCIADSTFVYYLLDNVYTLFISALRFLIVAL